MRIKITFITLIFVQGYENRLNQLVEDRNAALHKIAELVELESKLQKEIQDKQAYIYTLANKDGSDEDDGRMQSFRNDLEEAQALAGQLRKDLISKQLALDNAHREIEQRDSILNQLQKDLQNANNALSIRVFICYMIIRQRITDKLYVTYCTSIPRLTEIKIFY